MRCTTIASTLALAMAISAAPQGLLGGIRGLGNASSGNNAFPSIPGATTIEKAVNSCGSNTKLSCCNEANTSGDAISEASGLLADVLGGLGGVGQSGLGLFNGCSKLDVAALIGADDLLSSQCKQTAACCQDIKDGGQSGLIAIGVPCIALGGLL